MFLLCDLLGATLYNIYIYIYIYIYIGICEDLMIVQSIAINEGNVHLENANIPVIG